VRTCARDVSEASIKAGKSALLAADGGYHGCMGELDQMRITIRRDGDRTVIALEGDLDLHVVPDLDVAVDDVLAETPGSVEIDADGLDFVDSSGLKALLGARQRAVAAGAGFRISRSSEALDRILDMTQLQELLHPTGP
jgi:anti-anti-sigma factor